MELDSHLFPAAMDIDMKIHMGNWIDSDKQKHPDTKVQMWHFSQHLHDKDRFTMTRCDDLHHFTD